MLSVRDLQTEIMRALGTAVLQTFIELGELTVIVRRTRIVEALEALRDDSIIEMNQLMDICAADYPARPERFEIVYQLLSVVQNARVRVKIQVGEDTPVPTATGIYKSAGWFEREIWDMFGVPFEGHADMRRILTDTGFEGHPLRKDFPLTGFVEARYDPEKKRVVYEPVTLPQEYRVFDFESPWQGMTSVQLQRGRPEEEEGGE